MRRAALGQTRPQGVGSAPSRNRYEGEGVSFFSRSLSVFSSNQEACFLVVGLETEALVQDQEQLLGQSQADQE